MRTAEERKAQKLVAVLARYVHPGTGRQSLIAVDICDHAQAEKYAGAPNAKVIRARKDNRILEVHIKSWGDDSKMKSHGEG